MSSQHSVPTLDVDVVTPLVPNPFPSASERPCWRCYDEPVQQKREVLRAGVYFHDVDSSKEKAPKLIDTWCSGPLHVKALTANDSDGDHGKLLSYRSVTDRWKTWAMPMEMLAGDGLQIISVLLSEGLELNRKHKYRVLDYIFDQTPSAHVRTANTTGWLGDAFVLPDQVFGADNIWYQNVEPSAPYGVAGSFERWQERVASQAIDNDLLMFVISAAMAGPLLGHIGLDGGGFHIYGDSSTGKTTLLSAAVSVWGGNNFRRTWRSTTNGLEGAAALHSGTLLALDEIGEVDPKALYEAAYSLINGHGKTRANRFGRARQAANWQVFVLSTGEVTIASRIASGGLDPKAGQSLRLLDISVNGTHGAWDDLHGCPSGAAFADVIRDSARHHYGHAGPAFVTRLVELLSSGMNLNQRLNEIVAEFDGSDGQESRAARVFGVCALAGELAAAGNIVPWSAQQVRAAVYRIFSMWRSQRGAAGLCWEDVQILRAISEYIDRYRESRFSDIDGVHSSVRERSGYWRGDGDERIFLFTSVGLKEAARVHEIRRVIAALDRVDAFERRGANNRAAVTARRGDGSTPRLYHINPQKLLVAQDS